MCSKLPPSPRPYSAARLPANSLACRGDAAAETRPRQSAVLKAYSLRNGCLSTSDVNDQVAGLVLPQEFLPTTRQIVGQGRARNGVSCSNTA